MSGSRHVKHDLAALALLAGTVVLSVSLITYDCADPPGTLVYPPNASTQNASGPIGAYLAHATLTALGVGAYYLVATLFVVDFFLLARRSISEPSVRAAGWLFTLFGGTTLVSMAFPGLSPGPVMGAGGWLGAVGSELLELQSWLNSQHWFVWI